MLSIMSKYEFLDYLTSCGSIRTDTLLIQSFSRSSKYSTQASNVK